MLKKLSFALVLASAVLTIGALEPAPAPVEAGGEAALVQVQDLEPALVERAQKAPASADCQVASPEPWSLETDPLSKSVSLSCGSSCQALYFECLDDCDIAPFPGCYDFCRFDVLYPCYRSCIGG